MLFLLANIFYDYRDVAFEDNWIATRAQPLYVSQIQWKRNPFWKWKYKQYPVCHIHIHHHYAAQCSTYMQHTSNTPVAQWMETILPCHCSSKRHSQTLHRRNTFELWMERIFSAARIALHNWCAIMTSAAFGRFWAYSQQILSTFCHSSLSLLGSSSFSFLPCLLKAHLSRIAQITQSKSMHFAFQIHHFPSAHAASLLLRFHLVQIRLNRMKEFRFLSMAFVVVVNKSWVEESIVCCIVRLCC